MRLFSHRCCTSYFNSYIYKEVLELPKNSSIRNKEILITANSIINLLKSLYSITTKINVSKKSITDYKYKNIVDLKIDYSSNESTIDTIYNQNLKDFLFFSNCNAPENYKILLALNFFRNVINHPMDVFEEKRLKKAKGIYSAIFVKNNCIYSFGLDDIIKDGLIVLSLVPYDEFLNNSNTVNECYDTINIAFIEDILKDILNGFFHTFKEKYTKL